MAGVSLYLVDGFVLKIVSEEVGTKRLNLHDYPSHPSTMKALSWLFHAPIPRTITVPLEHTLGEQSNDIYLRSPSFPTFSFLEQLQDLLSMSEIFSDLDNLVVNKKNPWLPCQRLGDNIEEMRDGD
jgi:hypothetical protein